MPAAIRRLAALVATGALAAACGVAPPSPSPDAPDDPLEVYREIAEQVAAIRELDDAARSDPSVIDRETLRENLEAEFEASNPPEQLELADRIYRALGLLPAERTLGDLVLELQASQVIGYYDPSVDELFIVSGSGELGPTERATYAHEFTHELQDGTFDLESLGLEEASVDEGDRALGILSLVEGDAVSVQTSWMVANFTAEDLATVAADAADPAILDVLARTPAILLETALFPYQAGATFAQALITEGGYDRVNQAYDDLPRSTEQIIHPELYLAGEDPVVLELPDDVADALGEGWTVQAEDTLGELQLRVWLREGGVRGDDAREAVAGWGGDRIALLGGVEPEAGDVLVLISDWDTARDAGEFAAAARVAMETLGGRARAVIEGNRVVVAIATSDAVSASRLETLAEDLVAR